MKKKKDYRKPDPNYKLPRCGARNFDAQKRCVNFTEEGADMVILTGVIRVYECGNRIGVRGCKVDMSKELMENNAENA